MVGNCPVLLNFAEDECLLTICLLGQKRKEPPHPQTLARSQEGAQEDLFRVSRAWAASSFCCHSEEAETEAWLEASGAWKQRMWENGSWEPTLPQCPFSPQLPWGLLLFSFTKLGPCQGSGPHSLPRLCGCSRRGLRVARGWRIRVECLGTRKGETRGFIPLAGTYYQWGGGREFTISACGSLNGH